jgi:uncharacterized protein (DUF2236 family)
LDAVSALAERIDGIGLLAGPANVVMQLSWPAVGHGVVESRVHRGRLTEHPVKRARTTATYLAVAAMGTDSERQRYARAVDRAHAQVRSGPGSPVVYNAFDPELQLWVAACLYKGAEDVITRVWGPMDDDAAEDLYRASQSLGTTLQVQPAMWPPDRAAFEAYWQAGLERVSIDRTVRDYLYEVLSLRFLPVPAWLSAPAGRVNTWMSTGFLPAEFRTAMGLEWTARDEARFDCLIRALAATRRPLPGPVRRFPLNLYLLDFRLRSALGLRLV